MKSYNPFMLYLTVVTLVIGVVPYGEAKLEFVQVLFRHGDRSPVHNFPKNPHQENAWPQGYGQLSKIGMQQHFQLGKFLHTRYADFLGVEYVNKDIYIRSTDFDRTLMSAYSDLTGIYPPDGAQEWNPHIKWQPIPVHTIPTTQDFLLAPQDVSCPRYDELYDEALQSHDVKSFIQENKNFIDFIVRKTGTSPGIKKISEVWDTLYCQESHHFTQPKWLNKTIMDRLYTFSLKKYNIAYSNYEMKKIRGGVLINNITQNILNKAEGLLEKKNRKMIMYSAHDTTVVSLLSGLGLYDNIIPPYASCVMMELHRDTSGSYSVEIFYQKGPGTEPVMLTLPGCQPNCRLDKFVELVSDIRLTELQFMDMCSSVKKSRLSLSDDSMMIILGGILVIVLFITCRLRSKKKYLNNLFLNEKIV